MQAFKPMRTIATDVQFCEPGGTVRPATPDEAAEHLRQITDPRPPMPKSITFTVEPDTVECEQCHKPGEGKRLTHPRRAGAFQLPPGWWEVFGEDGGFFCSEACARAFCGETPGA